MGQFCPPGPHPSGNTGQCLETIFVPTHGGGVGRLLLASNGERRWDVLFLNIPEWTGSPRPPPDPRLPARIHLVQNVSSSGRTCEGIGPQMSQERALGETPVRAQVRVALPLQVQYLRLRRSGSLFPEIQWLILTKIWKKKTKTQKTKKPRLDCINHPTPAPVSFSFVDEFHWEVDFLIKTQMVIKPRCVASRSRCFRHAPAPRTAFPWGTQGTRWTGFLPCESHSVIRRRTAVNAPARLLGLHEMHTPPPTPPPPPEAQRAPLQQDCSDLSAEPGATRLYNLSFRSICCRVPFPRPPSHTAQMVPGLLSQTSFSRSSSPECAGPGAEVGWGCGPPDAPVLGALRMQTVFHVNLALLNSEWGSTSAPAGYFMQLQKNADF